MFEGRAEEAMNYYVSVFPNSQVLSVQRYGPNEAGPEGSILLAMFSLNGQTFRCIDSYVQHGFTFNPAISFFVTCDSEAEINRLHAQLSQEGRVLMPLDAYPFSPWFSWIQDKFGVTWQLSLANEREKE